MPGKSVEEKGYIMNIFPEHIERGHLEEPAGPRKGSNCTIPDASLVGLPTFV